MTTNIEPKPDEIFDNEEVKEIHDMFTLCWADCSDEEIDMVLDSME